MHNIVYNHPIQNGRKKILPTSPTSFFLVTYAKVKISRQDFLTCG